MNEFKDYDCIIFIDETGDESRNDNKNPLFGLGGVKIDKESYEPLRMNWVKCKETIGYANKPFHSSDFEATKPDEQQIEAINKFVEKDFPRFFSCIYKETRRNGENIESETSTDRKNIYYWLIKYIFDDALLHHKRALIVCESSSRDNNLEMVILGRQKNLTESQCSVDLSFDKKNAMIAGLEIADLVCHTAARGCRARLAGHNPPKDFEIMFGVEDNPRKDTLVEIKKNSYSPPEE